MRLPTTTLQIYHRYYKIPLEEYFNSVANFTNPWDEKAYQFVVHKILEATKDSGIVGMVRQKKDENYIYLDAAIRYPLVMDDRVSHGAMEGGKGPLVMDDQVSPVSPRRHCLRTDDPFLQTLSSHELAYLQDSGMGPPAIDGHMPPVTMDGGLGPQAIDGHESPATMDGGMGPQTEAAYRAKQD